MKLYKFTLVIICIIFSVNGTSSILEAKQINVAASDVVPAIFQDKDSSVKGFFPDILNEIAKESSWEIRYTYNSWSNNLLALRNAQVDLATCLIYSDEMAKYFDYSKEAAYTVWSILYSTKRDQIKNILDVENKKIGLVRDDLNGSYFKDVCKKFNLHCEFIYFTGYSDIFKAISNEIIDGGIVINLFGYSQESLYKVSRTSVIFNPVNIYFAVPKGKNQDILNTIDKYLSAWKKDAKSPYYTIINSWLAPSVSKESIPNWIIDLLGTIFLIAVIAIAIIFTIRKKVKQATKALKEANEKLEREIAERKKSENSIKAILEGTASEVESAFLFNLVAKLANALDSLGAYISIINPDTTRAKTMAAFFDDKIIANFSYRLEDSPTLSIIKNGLIIIKENFYSQFPRFKFFFNIQVESYIGIPLYNKNHQIIGVMSVINNHPIFDVKLAENLIKIFSKRAAIELERISQSEEIKYAYNYVSEINKLKSVILGNLTHELKTPLNGILGFANILDDSLSIPENLEMIKYIKNSAERLNTTLNNLLSLNEYESKSQTPIIVSIPASSIEHYFASGLISKIIEKGINFSCNILVPNLYILSDERLFSVIINNILENAFKFTEKGSIDITVNMLDSKNNYQTAPNISDRVASIVISDTGIGIDNDQLDTIFEPFRQISEGTARNFEGLGIGLTVTKKFIELMGGTIAIESTKEFGTKLTLIFRAEIVN